MPLTQRVCGQEDLKITFYDLLHITGVYISLSYLCLEIV